MSDQEWPCLLTAFGDLGFRAETRRFIAFLGSQHAAGVPLQLMFRVGGELDLPETEKAARENLCLPLLGGITRGQQEQVVDVLRQTASLIEA